MSIATPDSLEPNILKLRGRAWGLLSEKAQEVLVEECFLYWRDRGFPYDSFNEAAMLKELLGLNRAESSPGWNNGNIEGSTAGLRVANFFHPGMWSVRCRDAYAPMQRFNCDRSLRRVIRHALKIWPDLYSVNATNLRSMLRTFSKTTRVSNFRPTIAKEIIRRFSQSGDLVVDFSAGYSGRLLGSIAAGRRYAGIDPSFDQIQGGMALVNALRRFNVTMPHVEFFQGAAEEVLPSFASESANLVFSSPPYFDTERYSDDRSQSYVRFPEYGEWRVRFLEFVLDESVRVLKPGGYLALNVCNVENYSIADDAMRYCSSLLRHESTFRLCLARKPYLKKSDLGAYKYEPLFVFRKA
jgi:SAM-dependent methyltransferase